MYDLEERAVKVERQRPQPVTYKDVVMDCGYRIDLLVEDQVVVELKAVERVKAIHEAQLLSYLKLSGRPVGLLINFNVKLLRNGVRRYINRQLDVETHLVDARRLPRPECQSAAATKQVDDRDRPANVTRRARPRLSSDPVKPTQYAVLAQSLLPRVQPRPSRNVSTHARSTGPSHRGVYRHGRTHANLYRHSLARQPVVSIRRNSALMSSPS